VGHLAACVHPRVGPAGNGQYWFTGQGQGSRECFLQDLLDRPQTWLTAPAMKA
jgi:hypothetical protein